MTQRLQVLFDDDELDEIRRQAPTLRDATPASSRDGRDFRRLERSDVSRRSSAPEHGDCPTVAGRRASRTHASCDRRRSPSGNHASIRGNPSSRRDRARDRYSAAAGRRGAADHTQRAVSLTPASIPYPPPPPSVATATPDCRSADTSPTATRISSVPDTTHRAPPAAPIRPTPRRPSRE